MGRCRKDDTRRGTGFGNLQLGDLKIGSYRHLDANEVLAMKKMSGMI